MKIKFNEINKRSAGSNFFIMVVGALVCLVVAVILVGGYYFLLNYETERLNDTSGVDTKMPLLDKDGMNYFISRQRERVIQNVPNSKPITAISPVPGNRN
jgi:hypothetical protein